MTQKLVREDAFFRVYSNDAVYENEISRLSIIHPDPTPVYNSKSETSSFTIT